MVIGDAVNRSLDDFSETFLNLVEKCSVSAMYRNISKE